MNRYVYSAVRETLENTEETDGQTQRPRLSVLLHKGTDKYLMDGRTDGRMDGWVNEWAWI